MQARSAVVVSLTFALSTRQLEHEMHAGLAR